MSILSPLLSLVEFPQQTSSDTYRCCILPHIGLLQSWSKNVCKFFSLVKTLLYCGHCRRPAGFDPDSPKTCFCVEARIFSRNKYPFMNFQTARLDTGLIQALGILFNLQIMLDKVRNSDTEAFITFIGYSTAFNRASTMKYIGFSIHLAFLIGGWYSYQKVTMRWN